MEMVIQHLQITQMKDWKNIIDVNLDTSYDNFKTLKFKRYQYKFDVMKSVKNETGLIAQDVLETNFKKSVETLPYFENVEKTKKIKKIIKEQKLNDNSVSYEVEKEIEL